MTANTTTRRGLLKSLPAIIAAPAIVRIASIMPVTGGSIYTASNPWWTTAWTFQGTPRTIDGDYWGADDEARIRLLQRHWDNLWRQPNTEHARRMIKLLESKDDDQDAGSTP